jgi:hypothetical protein
MAREEDEEDVFRDDEEDDDRRRRGRNRRDRNNRDRRGRKGQEARPEQAGKGLGQTVSDLLTGGAAGLVGASSKGDNSAFGAMADALGAYGARRVGGALARMVPEATVARLRRIPGAKAVPPAFTVATALGLRAVGASPAVARLATDLATDFAVGLGERTTGEPMTEAGRKAAKDEQEAAASKLEEARRFRFVVLKGANPPIFHHPACIELPHPKDRNARVFMLTLEEIQGIQTEFEPCPTCASLIERQVKKIQTLEKEAEAMQTRVPKSASELLATEEGARIMQYVQTFFEPNEWSEKIDFLIEHLDEGEVALLSMPGLSRAEFELRLAAIKNRREQTSVEKTAARVKDGFAKAREAIGAGRPLKNAADRLNGLADRIRNRNNNSGQGENR